MNGLQVFSGYDLVYTLAAIDTLTGLVVAPDTAPLIADVKLYRDGSLKTLTTDYTITITAVAPAGTYLIRITPVVGQEFVTGEVITLVAKATYSSVVDTKFASARVEAPADPAAIYSYFVTPAHIVPFQSGGGGGSTGFRWV